MYYSSDGQNAVPSGRLHFTRILVTKSLSGQEKKSVSCGNLSTKHKCHSL